jgi:hypothetical protein
MFSWSGNKASFMGDVAFYGPQGINFYTENKVRVFDKYCLFGTLTPSHRLLPAYGSKRMQLETARPLTCQHIINIMLPIGTHCTSISILMIYLASRLFTSDFV